MVEQSLLSGICVVDIEHILGEVFVFLTVKGIEVGQEIYYFTFVFIIQH
jgi:hypothetical protein